MLLTAQVLRQEAANFTHLESEHSELSLYGVTDGKAVGTYLEYKFKRYLNDKGYVFEEGNSASGIDFPDINVDLKVTSIKKPQSSCPFKTARQKIYGLGYSLLIFVYNKSDNPSDSTTNLNILHTIYIEQERTADYQTTTSLLHLLGNNGNRDDLIAYMQDKNLPIDEVGAGLLAEEIMQRPPLQGFLTISNALQWRLQYTRVIEKAGQIDGIIRVK